jgi:hypothetical protein
LALGINTEIMGEIEKYRESVNRARTWFSENHAGVLTSFDILSAGYAELGRCLQLGRDAQDKTHVSLAPLLLIQQRQAFVALDMLASRQAYQAWLIVRPGVECGLIVGKWLDDIENFHVWQRRLEDPKSYSREYSGTKLISRSLPRSKDLQGSLKRINDLFAHPNPDYYLRHMDTQLVDDGVLVELKFFDSDDFHWASVLGMLHLLILMQDSLARALAVLFVNLDHEPDSYGLQTFQHAHRSAAVDAAGSGTPMSQIIYEIGLWHLAPDA